MGTLGRVGAVVCAGVVQACGGAPPPSSGSTPARLLLPARNENGVATTLRVGGGPVVDPGNPFFQVLGTNGRTCSTCHVPEDNFSITPRHLQARFDATGGTDPIFRSNDGTDSPNADVSTVDARRGASSQLLSRGTLRVGLGMPAGADFELVEVDDPYGYASAHELSLFRRPLPSTNLDLASVMFDGRETSVGASLRAELAHQALDATVGHAQAARAPTQAQLDAIVDYELQLFTAQSFTSEAGALARDGGRGGPDALSEQSFYPGINDLAGDWQTGAAFDPAVFSLYRAWDASPSQGRAAVARGEALFNHHPIRITGVAGLNDDPALGSPTALIGTCSTCHDAPNLGNQSAGRMMDLGLSEVQPAGGLEVQGCRATPSAARTPAPSGR